MERQVKKIICSKKHFVQIIWLITVYTMIYFLAFPLSTLISDVQSVQALQRIIANFDQKKIDNCSNDDCFVEQKVVLFSYGCYIRLRVKDKHLNNGQITLTFLIFIQNTAFFICCLFKSN
jgi:hypothetical protein